MSTFTKYKKIEKPISIERYSVDIVNKNSDIIDSELHKLELKNESQDNLLGTRASREALDAEASRAAAKENTIENNLSSEISRAQSAEYQIFRDLGSEVIRASEAEAGLDAKLSAHIRDNSNPHHVTKEQVGLGNADNTSDMDKPVSIDVQAALDALYQQLAGYTDQEIADLIGGAPSTLDTLGKLAQAMQSNGNVVTALDEAIGKKASAAELDSHVKDKANPHAVTKAQLGLGNVDNTADASKSVNYANSAGNADRVDDYHAYQLQNCTTAGVPEATYIKSTYNYGTFLLKAYNSSGNAVCGVEVEKAAKAGSADSVAYSNVTGRPNMYWEGDVFHLDF